MFNAVLSKFQQIIEWINNPKLDALIADIDEIFNSIFKKKTDILDITSMAEYTKAVFDGKIEIYPDYYDFR